MQFSEVMPNRLVRIGPVITLPDIIRKLGHDPAAVFAATGIDPELFDDADNRVPMYRLGIFAAEAAKLTGRSDIGLLIAAAFGPKTIGLVGQVVAEGPDIRTSLRNLSRLLYYHDQSAYVSITETGNEAILKYELKNPDYVGAHIILEAAIGIGMRLMQSLCGKNWSPNELNFSRRKPDSVKAHIAFFNAPLRFSAPHDAIVFAASDLDKPVSPAARLGNNAALSGTYPFSEFIRHQIASHIGLAPTTSSAIAEALGMSRSSLHRRLSEEGSNYHALVEEVRFARSRRLLAVGDAPLVEVAFAAGYPDFTAFSRAFRRWAGIPPGQWRSENRMSS